MASKARKEESSESGYCSLLAELNPSLPSLLSFTQDSDYTFEYSDVYKKLQYGHCSVDSFCSSMSPVYTRGILFDRIKEAHDTIEDLSSKLFQCENDIVILNERGKTYEEGFYNLQKENKVLCADQITKDELLEKVNLLDEQVRELLNTQENLAEKHTKQEISLDKVKKEKELLVEENTKLKEFNTFLGEKSKEDSLALEKLKFSESKLTNKFLIIQIQKEALSSEYDRVKNLFYQEEEKSSFLENKIKSLETHVTTFDDNNMTWTNKLNSVQERNKLLETQLENTLNDKSVSINQIKKENDTIVCESKTLKNELNAIKESQFVLQDKFNQALKENSYYRQQIDNLTEQNNLLCSQTKIKAMELESSELKFKELKNEVESLLKKLTISESNKVDIKKRFEETKQKWKSKMREFKKEINDLQQHTVKMENDYQNKLIEIHKNCDMQIEKMKKSNEEVEQEKNLLQHNGDSLKTKYESVKQNLDSLSKKFADNVETYKQKIQTVETKYSSLQEKYIDLEQTIRKYKNQCDLFEVNNEDLKQQHANYLKQIEDGDTKEKNLKETVESLLQENEVLKRQNKENLHLISMVNEQSRRELEDEKNSSNMIIETLKMDALKLKDKCTSLQESIVKLNREYKKNTSMLCENHETEMSQHQEKYNDIEEKNAMLNTKLLQAQEDFEQSTNLYKDQQTLMKRLTDELEVCRCDLGKLAELEILKNDNQYEIDDLRKQIELLEKENEKLLSEKKENSMRYDGLLQKMSLIAQDGEQFKKQLEVEKQQSDNKEQRCKKYIYELSRQIKKLKFELSQERLSKSSQAELDVLRVDYESIKTELQVLSDLNKKLEEVNQITNAENDGLRKRCEHLLADIGTLKSSFEEVLAKELEKQRSGHLIRENDLLKKLSTLSCS